jgi:ABC-type glycerol-3-phosphate transport system substrate-binding protein
MKFPEEVYYKREDFLSNQKFVAHIILEENPEWDIIRINGQYNEVVEVTGDPDWPGKHLVDFSEIEEFRNGILPELLTEKSKSLWNGIIPGPFIEGQYWSLWVNKKVVQKIGIEVKQFGMTADDFLGYLKAVYQYNIVHPEDKIIALFNALDWPTIFAIGVQLFASSFDNPSDFINNELTTKRIDAWEKTLVVVEQMSQYKPLNENWRKVNWEKSNGVMLDGQYLFFVNGSWMYNIWQKIDEQKVVDCMPAELPVFKKTELYPANYNVSWGVLKNAPHKEAAIKFLLAMNKPGTSEMWVRYTKCPSGIKGNLTGLSFGSDQFENFSSHIQNYYKDYSYKMLENSSWLIFGQNHSNSPHYFTEVIEGKITAHDAIRLIKSNLNK